MFQQGGQLGQAAAAGLPHGSTGTQWQPVDAAHHPGIRAIASGWSRPAPKPRRAATCSELHQGQLLIAPGEASEGGQASGATPAPARRRVQGRREATMNRTCGRRLVTPSTTSPTAGRSAPPRRGSRGPPVGSPPTSAATASPVAMGRPRLRPTASATSSAPTRRCHSNRSRGGRRPRPAGAGSRRGRTAATCHPARPVSVMTRCCSVADRTRVSSSSRQTMGRAGAGGPERVRETGPRRASAGSGHGPGCASAGRGRCPGSRPSSSRRVRPSRAYAATASAVSRRGRWCASPVRGPSSNGRRARATRPAPRPRSSRPGRAGQQGVDEVAASQAPQLLEVKVLSAVSSPASRSE